MDIRRACHLWVALGLLAAAALAQPPAQLDDLQKDDPQKIESRRQDNLLALAPEKLMAIPAIGASAWSPDGNRIVFVSNLSGQQNLWLVPAAGGWPVQLTVGERPARRPAWSPSGKFVAYESDAAGDGLADIFVVKVENGEVTNVSNSPGIGEEDAAWSPESRYLAWSSRQRDGSSAIESYDMLLRRRRSLTPDTPPGTRNLHPLWSPDGKWIACTRLTPGGDSSIFLIEVADGTALNLTPHEGRQRWTLASWSPDGSRLLVTSDARNGHGNIALLDVKSKTVRWITEPSTAELRAGSFSPDGKQLTWSATRQGSTGLYLHDLAAAATTEVTPPLGANRWGGSPSAFSSDGRQLLWRSDGPQAPAELWSYDIATRKSRQLTQAFVGGLRAEDMVAPYLVRYPVEGVEARALVYAPYNQIKNGHAPVIVFTTGGRDFVNGFAPEIQFVVNLGYFVIVPELSSATAPEARAADVRRMMAAAGWLKTNPYVDGKKLIAMSTGRGTRLVLATLGTEPALWSAGLIVGPWPLPPLPQPQTPVSAGPGLGITAAGQPAEPNSAVAPRQSFSPPPEAAKITAPLLLAGGGSDLPPAAEAARKGGAKVDLKLYESGARPNRSDAWRRAAAFLKFYVPAPGCGCSLE